MTYENLFETFASVVLEADNCKPDGNNPNTKGFIVVRRAKKYTFDVPFKKLARHGFVPKFMSTFDGKDEIVFEHTGGDE